MHFAAHCTCRSLHARLIGCAAHCMCSVERKFICAFSLDWMVASRWCTRNMGHSRATGSHVQLQKAVHSVGCNFLETGCGGLPMGTHWPQCLARSKEVGKPPPLRPPPLCGLTREGRWNVGRGGGCVAGDASEA